MFISLAVGVAGLGLSVVGMAGNAAAQNASAYATTEVGKAQLKERNANANVTRYIQGINNKKKGRALDKNLAAAQTNLSRLIAQATGAKLERQIGAAEAVGAYTAHAAMNGQLGGSVDVIAQTLKAKQARQEVQMDRAIKAGASDAAMQIGNIMDQGLSSLEMGNLSAGSDNSAHIQQGPNYASFIGGLLMGNAKDIGSIFGSISNPKVESTTNYSLTTASNNTASPWGFKASTPSWGLQ